MKYLDRSFFARNTRVVALELIGQILIFETDRGSLIGMIVETEAYFGADDPASHAYCGMTPRNRVMFGAPGKAYVYFTYGNHHCLNVVTEEENIAGAVLIRAVEPLEGLDVMRKNRGDMKVNHLTNGPGKLTQAFGLTKAHSGLDLNDGPIRVLAGNFAEPIEIDVTPRIGISRAKDELLRFYLKGNFYVSR